MMRVIEGSGKRAEDRTAEMAERIKDIIDEYSGQMTLAAAIGVLEIVKSEIREAAE